MKTLPRNNAVAFRSISQMDEHEAQDLALKLNLPPETRKSKGKEQNYVVRNGLLKKLQANQIHFTTQQTKIITDFNSPWEQEKVGRNNADQRQRDFQISDKNNGNLGLKKSNSFINDFLTEQPEQSESLRQDFCRAWYQKMAMEAHVVYLQQQNQRKDELINQLRAELQSKSSSQNHFPAPLSQSSSHNKSLSHHPGFSMQGQPIQVNNGNHWGGIHPSRNFNNQSTSSRNF